MSLVLFRLRRRQSLEQRARQGLSDQLIKKFDFAIVFIQNHWQGGSSDVVHGRKKHGRCKDTCCIGVGNGSALQVAQTHWNTCA